MYCVTYLMQLSNDRTSAYAEVFYFRQLSIYVEWGDSYDCTCSARSV